MTSDIHQSEVQFIDAELIW